MGVRNEKNQERVTVETFPKIRRGHIYAMLGHAYEEVETRRMEALESRLNERKYSLILVDFDPLIMDIFLLIYVN